MARLAQSEAADSQLSEVGQRYLDNRLALSLQNIARNAQLTIRHDIPGLTYV